VYDVVIVDGGCAGAKAAREPHLPNTIRYCSMTAYEHDTVFETTFGKRPDCSFKVEKFEGSY
jgi:hypothetical protein